MNKKLMATLCAVATAVSTIAPAMPVLAVDGDIAGSTVYVDKEVFKLTLPTTASQTFILDPEGLVGATVGDDGKLVTTESEGSIVAPSSMKAKNGSSLPVYLTATAKVTGSDDLIVAAASAKVDAVEGDEENPGTPEVPAKTAAENAKEATTATVALALDFKDAKATKGKECKIVEGSGEDETQEDLAADAATTVDLSKTEADIDIIMPAATYNFVLADDATIGSTNVEDYKYSMEADTSSAVDIAINGACSTAFNWKEYVGETATKNVGLNIVFKFTKAEYDAAEDTYSKSTASDKDVTGKATSATTAYGKFNAANDAVWLDLSESANGGIIDASKLSNVKLDGKDCASTVDSKWIKVTWAQMKDAGAVWNADGTYEFAFTYDGIDYEVGVVPNKK